MWSTLLNLTCNGNAIHYVSSFLLFLSYRINEPPLATLLYRWKWIYIDIDLYLLAYKDIQQFGNEWMAAIVIWWNRQAEGHSFNRAIFILLKSSIWKYHFICDFNYIKLNENLFHIHAVPAAAFKHVIIRKHENGEKIHLKTLWNGGNEIEFISTHTFDDRCCCL